MRLVISQIAPLQLKPEQVSVFTPFDLCVDAEEIIVTVIIHEKEGRTDDVLKEMSSRLVAMFRDKCFPGVFTEVNVVVINPKHCSSSAD